MHPGSDTKSKQEVEALVDQIHISLHLNLILRISTVLVAPLYAMARVFAMLNIAKDLFPMLPGRQYLTAIDHGYVRVALLLEKIVKGIGIRLGHKLQSQFSVVLYI
jgi:hypothetical protein